MLHSLVPHPPVPRQWLFCSSDWSSLSNTDISPLDVKCECIWLLFAFCILYMVHKSGVLGCCFFPEPYFVQAVDYGNYIYFFFREIAVEYNSMGKVRAKTLPRMTLSDSGGGKPMLFLDQCCYEWPSNENHKSWWQGQHFEKIPIAQAKRLAGVKHCTVLKGKCVVSYSDGVC